MRISGPNWWAVAILALGRFGLALGQTDTAWSAITDNPLPPTPASYPSTLTSSWKSTTTEINTAVPPGWDGISIYQVIIEEWTTIDGWPSSPTAFPHTHVGTRQGAETHSSWLAGRPSTTIQSEILSMSILSTWVAWEPRPTDMAPGLEPPCEACRPAGWKGHPRCEALGLDTACNKQCAVLDGRYWCHKHVSGLLQKLEGPTVMGRVCWGNGTEYVQLLEPCVETDHKVACTPCEGRDWLWSYSGDSLEG